ncbi:MAG: glycosyltransferase family 2 protein [Paludibacteraceae bacterium]|nr:glycosyltransferase family 2 protein [Paludibacteraceae bacterium]
MTDIYFSIVIPLYNKQNAIAATLQSVLAQTYTNYEIIVVDDGSTDDSARIAEEYIREVKGAENCEAETTASRLLPLAFRLIKKNNGGVSSARNRGVQEARYDYIALLDGDDLWDEHYLEEQVKFIQDFPKAKMWGVSIAFIKYNRRTKWEQGMGDGYRGYVENYFGTSHNDLFCSSSVVICREVFNNVGYFDERIASSEDLDMWYRIILHYPVAFYDKVLAFYNQDAENRVAYDTDTRFPLTKDIKYYFDKHNAVFDCNPVFSHFMNNYVAANLLKDGYYFGTKQERIDSDVIVAKLRYQDIHPKYRWIFKTPRCIGWIVYQIVSLKKKLLV